MTQKSYYFLPEPATLPDEVNKIICNSYQMNLYTPYEAAAQQGKFNWKTWVDGFQKSYRCFTATSTQFN